MKKLILLFASLLFVTYIAVAQLKLYVYQNDGTRTEFVASTVDSIAFSTITDGPDQPDDPIKPADPTNGYEYVDLGLPSGTKWATMNVGAESPEDYGDYFAWGETEPKSTYNWGTYKWCEGSENTQTKYCTNSYYGTVDNKTILELSDDAANANWGGDWRMPTKAELEELRTECTWTWITEKGVNGYTVTGPNGNSIFLPATGNWYDYFLYDAGSNGNYWSSSLNTYNSYDAYNLGFDSYYVDWHFYYRSCGHSVRPVLCVGFTNDAIFDSNGGEGTMPSIAIDHAEQLSIPENKFTRSGYEFVCWNTKADGTGTRYYEGDMFSVGSDITLYAQWILHSEIPMVENPSADKTTFLFQIEGVACDNFELYLMGIDRVWDDVPEMKFDRVEGTKDWFQLTIDALDENNTNFKIRANGDWIYEPKSGYIYLSGASKYVKDGADGGNINNLMVIQPTGGKVIALKVVEFVTPCLPETVISEPSGYHSGSGYVD